MKVEVIVKRAVCDLCESKESVLGVCQGCGIDICHKCEKLVCITVHKDVHSYNTYHYCPVCCQDQNIVTSDLFRAFQTIERLRYEREGFYKTFEERAEVARVALEKLLNEKVQAPHQKDKTNPK